FERVWRTDVLRCERCGEKMKVLAFVTERRRSECDFSPPAKRSASRPPCSRVHRRTARAPRQIRELLRSRREIAGRPTRQLEERLGGRAHERRARSRRLVHPTQSLGIQHSCP